MSATMKLAVTITKSSHLYTIHWSSKTPKKTTAYYCVHLSHVSSPSHGWVFFVTSPKTSCLVPFDLQPASTYEATVYAVGDGIPETGQIEANGTARFKTGMMDSYKTFSANRI